MLQFYMIHISDIRFVVPESSFPSIAFIYVCKKSLCHVLLFFKAPLIC